MLKSFIKEVVVVVVGKQAEPIADLLDSKKHVNEFLIAKKMNITINQTRNILYKLSDHGLVSSIRKKDKRKGWYTYFWKIESFKVLEFLKRILEKKKEQMENQIKSRETKQFYVCKTCNIEFNEENALLRDFTCNECGDVFSLKDNAKLLRELNRNKDKLKKQLIDIEQEMDKLKEKAEKIREKEIAKKKSIIKKTKKKIIKRKKKSVKKKPLRKKVKGKKKIKKKVKKRVVKRKVKKKVVKKKKRPSKKISRKRKIVKGKTKKKKPKKLLKKVKKAAKKTKKKIPKKKTKKRRR